MLHGVGGHLVSHEFAERWMAEGRDTGGRDPDRERGRAALARWWISRGSLLGPASPVRVIADVGLAPVLDLLGFELRAPRLIRGDEAIAADASGAGLTCPALVTRWGAPMDTLWPDLARESQRLGSDWAISFNGRALRLCDMRRPHARAFLEFDLEQLVERPSAHALCWALLRADALRDRTAGIVSDAARYGIAVAASLRDGVRDALADLLSGILAQGGRQRPTAAGRDDADRVSAALGEALTVVYRVLFLLFAESRALVPTWHPVYRRSYTVEALRELAERPGGSRGLWESLQALARLAHAGCRAGTLTVTPFNGRLFAPAHAPVVDTSQLDDDLVARAMLSLTTHRAQGRRDRIWFRDLGVEQLGAVYESVLDYEPVVSRAPAPLPAPATATGARDLPPSPPAIRLAGTGLVRKASGTFYTPVGITNYLVRQTLDPLLVGAGPDDILRLRVLDPAMGSGAFLVAACRHLAGAYEAALVRDRGLFPSEITDDDRAGYRRLVAQHCLYGVDVNPMAVQVARLSVWLSTLAQDRPLSFLDHRLVTGNSLVGASLDDLARQPPGGRAPSRPRDMLPLFEDDGPGAALRRALPIRARLADVPDDTAAIVHDKERILADLDAASGSLGTIRRMADLWCACWFWPEGPLARPSPAEYSELLTAIRTGRSSLPPHVVEPRLAEAGRVSARHRFLHWTLAFPEVFFAGDGSPRADAGFDAILGNPPWEMMRGDAGSVDAREDRRRESALLTRFVRQSGVYRACADGHVNQYQLFVERSIRLLRHGGRMGLVVPWGLASDQGSAALRRLLLDRCRIDGFVGFDNAAAIFPIHRGVRFLVLSASTGLATERVRARLGERDPDRLDPAPPDARAQQPRPGNEVVVSPALLRRLAGDGLAFPWVRHSGELQLIERLVAAMPPLGHASGWAAGFGRELNATDDRARFTTDPGGLPVIEGKHVTPFQVRVQDATRWVRMPGNLPSSHLRQAVQRPRLAYRDVASSTNRTTLIAGVVPAGTVTVHTLFCLRTPLSDDDQWFLCGVLNSLVANFLVRPWVTTHLGTTTVERLPVPRPAPGDSDRDRIVALARRLSSGGDADDARVEIEARVMRLYGLSARELPVIFETFPLVARAHTDAIADRLDRLASGRGRV